MEKILKIVKITLLYIIVAVISFMIAYYIKKDKKKVYNYTTEADPYAEIKIKNYIKKYQIDSITHDTVGIYYILYFKYTK